MARRGIKPFLKTDAAATKFAISTVPCDVVWLNVDNTANAAKSFIQLFDKASADVTVGTTVADYSIVIPASSALDLPLPASLHFSTALTAACTTTVGGSSAPGSAIVVNASMQPLA